MTLEDQQQSQLPEATPQDHRERSSVRLASVPMLPRSYSTFTGQTQLTRVISHYVSGRSQHAERHGLLPTTASTPALRKPEGSSDMEAPRLFPRDLTMASAEGEEASEYSEPKEDLEGLLQYFEGLAKRGVRLTEVTYVVNSWTLGGVIPLWHHGFVLRAEEEGYLTLDFSRRGILWDTFDTYPDLPDSTIFAKKYYINTDPDSMKSYCEETKPFSWHSNDCHHWARGVMQVMRIMEDPLEDQGAFRTPESVDCLLCGGQSLERRVFPTCIP